MNRICIAKSRKMHNFHLIKITYSIQNSHTSLSRLNLLNSSSDSNLDFWSGTTRGILKINRGLGCSYNPMESNGNIPANAAVGSFIGWCILNCGPSASVNSFRNSLNKTQNSRKLLNFQAHNTRKTRSVIRIRLRAKCWNCCTTCSKRGTPWRRSLWVNQTNGSASSHEGGYPLQPHPLTWVCEFKCWGKTTWRPLFPFFPFIPL